VLFYAYNNCDLFFKTIQYLIYHITNQFIDYFILQILAINLDISDIEKKGDIRRQGVRGRVRENSR